MNPAGLNTTATMPEARSYLQRYPESTVITWNSELGYNYCYYTSPLNGSQISMWLEDADSIAAKLELMDQYDLGGCGHLGSSIRNLPTHGRRSLPMLTGETIPYP